MIEEWRAFIPGYYEVSDQGRMRSVARIVRSKGNQTRLSPSRVLKPDMLTRYARVSICVDGDRKHQFIHLAVLEVFIGPKPAGMQARHLNGDRTDNRLANLAYGTPVENAADKIAHGTQPLGVAVGRGVLNEQKVLRALSLEGKLSLREIAECLDCGLSTVHHVFTGRTWSWFTGRPYQSMKPKN